jgi:hypothetical protein
MAHELQQTSSFASLLTGKESGGGEGKGGGIRAGKDGEKGSWFDKSGNVVKRDLILCSKRPNSFKRDLMVSKEKGSWFDKSGLGVWV